LLFLSIILILDAFAGRWHPGRALNDRFVGHARREASWIDPKTCVFGTPKVELSDLVQSINCGGLREKVSGTTVDQRFACGLIYSAHVEPYRRERFVS